MDKRIAMIFPNAIIVERAREILKNMALEFPIFEASRDEALIIANSCIAENAKVIVSRGGTAAFLRRKIDIPVVEIKFTFFDFAYSIQKAMKYSNKIAIMGSSSAFECAERSRKLLGENVAIIHLKSDENMEQKIEEKVALLSKQGVEVLIGGTLVVNIGRRHGLISLMTDVDEYSIKQAIEEAVYNLKIQQEREERFETINSILYCASEGIIGVDMNGNITNMNNIAKQILGVKNDKGQNYNIKSILPFTKIMDTVRSGKEVYGELCDIGNYSIAINSVPINVENRIVGAVATIQESKKIQILEQKIRKKLLAKGHVARNTFDDIIGKSRSITLVKEKGKKYANVDSTILIMGETGTGKELFAQSIHNYSKRKESPFVAVNCAALPQSILESELFGYVKGAFTGASSEGKAGIFEIAHTGTIFLDEISEIPHEVQVRLLRVIQEKELTRIGDDKIISVDVRILAASNKNLLEEIAKGNFREDLYYRLCVLILELPPLRLRNGDIAELVNYFIRNISKKHLKKIEGITPGAVGMLEMMDWPGNIRHLSNIVERLVVICENSVIDESTVYEATATNEHYNMEDYFNDDTKNNGIISKVESELIKKALKDTDGNKKEAAKKLGISTTTLWRRLNRMKF